MVAFIKFLLLNLAIVIANPLLQRQLNDDFSIAQKQAISNTDSLLWPELDIFNPQTFNNQFQQALNQNFERFGESLWTNSWYENKPNVCKREEMANTTESSKSPYITLASIMTSCIDYPDQHRCVTQKIQNGERITVTIIYECCSGWERGTNGLCDQVSELESIKNTIKSHNLTHFYSIIEKSGFEAEWGIERPDEVKKNITIFAPTDDAFLKVDGGQVEIITLDATTDEHQLASNAISGATVDGLKMAYDFVDDEKMTAQDGSVLRVNFYNYPMYFATINCAPITEKNIKAIGGIIHTTSRVVVGAKQTLWELIGQNTDLTKFAGLVNPELQEQLLDEDSHLTVLAFTDDAFETLPMQIKKRITDGVECMSDLISAHILPTTVCSAGVQSQVAFVRNQNNKLINVSRITADEGVEIVKFHGFSTVRKDVMATNGVLHIIDGVIIEDQMLNANEWLKRYRADFYELIENDEMFIGQLNADEKMTVFIPSSRALQKLVNESFDKENVKNVLGNHLMVNSDEVGRAQTANQFTESFVHLPESIKTINGNELNVERIQQNNQEFGMLTMLFTRPPQYTIGGCSTTIGMKMNVCGADLIGVDSVIKMPADSVYSIIKNNPDLSSFADLIDSANLVDKLTESDFKSTLIAPSNTVIDQLSGEQRANLSQNIDALILPGMLCSNSMGSLIGPLSRTLHKTDDGRILISTGSIGNDNLSIGGAAISKTDMTAKNGLVQMVNSMPQAAVLRRQPSIQQLFSHWINH